MPVLKLALVLNYVSKMGDCTLVSSCRVRPESGSVNMFFADYRLRADILIDCASFWLEAITIDSFLPTMGVSQEK